MRIPVLSFVGVSFMVATLMGVAGCGPAVGAVGGPCEENGSCDDGLVCEASLCVDTRQDGGSNGFGDGGVNGDGGRSPFDAGTGQVDSGVSDGGVDNDGGAGLLDTDLDGIPDLNDDDDDNDTFSDEDEVACGSDPLVDTSLPTDTDNDGACDPLDVDDDGDTFADDDEVACGSDPLVDTSLPTDTDNDGACDPLDDDDDDDTFTDEDEAACGSDPLVDTSFPADNDNDGDCDAIDGDDDNDTFADDIEAACGSDPLVDTSFPTDTDSDGDCDAIDGDDDNDTFTDDSEAACGSDPLLDTSIPTDTDNDGDCDAIDADDDNDTFADDNELVCGSDPLLDTSLPPDNDNDDECDALDADDDNDTFSDADELACGSDPLSATALPLDSDDDATCNAIDPCPLRADDNCEVQSDYLDCFAIRLDGSLGEVPTGAYWIDSDGTGANAPWQAWCDMDIDGGGWTLSIHQKATGNWADWDHDMDPAAVTGTYVASPVHDSDFYRGFGDLIPDYDSADFLFASGDSEHWLVTTSLALRLSNGGQLAEYADVPMHVRRDSVGYERHTYNMYFRAGALDEDPWIGLNDHHDEGFRALYGEGDESLYTEHVKNIHDGANVMVRRNGVNGWDNDGDGFPNQDEILCGTNALDINDVPNDEDGDFVCDAADHFLGDATEGYDFDADGIGDNADLDDDEDGDNDDVDPFPRNIVLTRDLSDMNMSGWDLRQFNMNFADLTDANLRFADMRSIDLDDAVLTGSDWAFARVHDLVQPCKETAYRGGCDLSSVTLGEVDLRGATLTNANFTGSNLWFTRFVPDDIIGSDWTSVAFAPFADNGLGGPLRCLSGNFWRGGCNAGGNFVPFAADLSQANLVGANLDNSRFEHVLSVAGSDWSGAFITAVAHVPAGGGVVIEDLVCATSNYRGGCDLSGKVFGPGTQLGFETTFMGANFIGATCGGCVTQGANFKNALFDGANFTDAVLLQSDFTGARFDGATFQFGNLRFSELDNIVAIGTNFDSANLTSCRVRNSVINNSSFRFAQIMGADFSNTQASATDWRDVFNMLSDGVAPVNYSGANLTDACMFTEVNIPSIGRGATPPPTNMINTVFNGVYGFFDQSKRCAAGSIGGCAGNQTSWVCPLP